VSTEQNIFFFTSHKLSGLYSFHINRRVTETLKNKVSFTEAFFLTRNGGVLCTIFFLNLYDIGRDSVQKIQVSQEEWTKLRESVPYVKIYRYNPKHLYPKLKGYGDNGQRSLKV